MKYKGQTITRIIEQGELLSLIDVGGNTFWVRTAQIESPASRVKATPLTVQPETKKPLSLGWGSSQHRRWHVARNLSNPRCRYCQGELA